MILRVLYLIIETSFNSSKKVPFFLVNLFSSNLIFEAPEHQNSVNHSKPIQFYVAKLKNGQLAINCVDRNCCKRKRFSMFWHLLLSSTNFVFARIRFIHSFFEIDFYWFVAVVNCTFLPDIQIIRKFVIEEWLAVSSS